MPLAVPKGLEVSTSPTTDAVDGDKGSGGGGGAIAAAVVVVVLGGLGLWKRKALKAAVTRRARGRSGDGDEDGGRTAGGAAAVVSMPHAHPFVRRRTMRWVEQGRALLCSVDLAVAHDADAAGWGVEVEDRTVRVTAVRPGGPAEGVVAVGDVVLEVDGADVRRNAAGFREAAEAARARGDALALVVERTLSAAERYVNPMARPVVRNDLDEITLNVLGNALENIGDAPGYLPAAALVAERALRPTEPPPPPPTESGAAAAAGEEGQERDEGKGGAPSVTGVNRHAFQAPPRGDEGGAIALFDDQDEDEDAGDGAGGGGGGGGGGGSSDNKSDGTSDEGGGGGGGGGDGKDPGKAVTKHHYDQQ